MVYFKQAHCNVPECPAPHLAKGYCRTHYYRLQRTGATDEAPPHVKATCSVDGCPSVVKSKGMCNKHYQQLRNSGAVQDDDTRTPEERFWDNVDRSGGPDACWPWTRAKLPSGYGRVRWGGKLRPAHVVAWEIVNGPVPDGHELDHVCHDPKVCQLGDDCQHRGCCNPQAGLHMVPVTSEVNRSPERSAFFARGASHQSAKTRCPDGHFYNEFNTYVVPGTGARHCRRCNRDAAWRVRNGDEPRPETEADVLAMLPTGTPASAARCGHGHLWTTANTYITPDGDRKCRECDRRGAAHHRAATPKRRRPRKPRTTPVNYVRGERVHTAKLTSEQVATIRERYAAGGIRQRDLGAEFGVSQNQISWIVRGKSWSTTNN